MLDLRDDGTIGIDFEDGQSPVVLARPKFGAYRRLRSEMERIRVDIAAFQKNLIDKTRADLALAEDAKLPDDAVATINTETREYSDNVTAAWWQLVLVGDESFKTLAVEGSVPPMDDWPAYLIYGTAIIPTAIEHWRRIPLGRGGKLVTEPETTEPTTE